MQTDADKQYDAEDDPDSGTATTPEEVEANSDRDQAEGDAPSAGSEPEGAGG